MTISIKKIFIILGKAVLISAGFFLICMGLLTVFLSGYRQKVVNMVMKKANESLQGDVHIGNIDISLWRYFPKTGVEISDVRVMDSVYKKPFLKAGLVTVRLGLWELLGNELKVHRISLKNVEINNVTDSNGYSNAYVMRPANPNLPLPPGTREKKKTLLLNDVFIENVHFISRHAVKEKYIDVTLRKGQLYVDDENAEEWKFKFEQDVYIRALGFNMARGAWLKNKPLQATWTGSFFHQQGKIIINETATLINSHPYKISGVFNLTDSGFFSLKVFTGGLDFREGRSLVADNIERKLKMVEMEQKLTVDALIEGTLAYKGDPKVRVNWIAPSGKVTLPVATLDSTSFYGHYYNERIPGMGHKDDNSELILQKVTAKWGPVVLAGDSVVMTNLQDPYLNFRFTSGVDLSKLDEALNLNTMRIDGGSASLEMVYKGPLLTDVSALGKMRATLVVANGKATYLPRKLQFNKVSGTIVLSENLLELENIKTDVNGNHVEVNLKGRQIGALVGNGAGNAKSFISLDVYSPKINMNSLSVLLAKRQGARKLNKPRSNYPLKQIDDILENGTVALNLKIGELIQNRLKATQITGKAIFREEDLLLEKLKMNAAGGTIVVNAELKRRPDENLNASLNAEVTRVDVKQFFYGMNNFGQDGLTHENLEGIFTHHANVKAILTSSGKLLPQSVEGTVDFALENGALKNHEGIQNIKKFIFKKRDLANIQFARISNQFTIRNDTVYIPRMEIYSSALLMFLEGKYGLKGGSDLAVQLPLSNLKNREDEFEEDENIGTDARVGPSVWFRARQREDGSFKFGLDAFKKLRKKEEMPAGVVPRDQQNSEKEKNPSSGHGPMDMIMIPGKND